MNKNLSILILWLLLTGLINQNKIADPTGTYELDRETRIVGGDTYGYFGQIDVKKISADKIVMKFMICMGAPSYNSGSFIDTLDYQDNAAIYKDPANDPGCKITFYFNSRGITVKEQTENYNFGCGFGHAVVASGFFKKISSAIPELNDNLGYTGGPILEGALSVMK